MSDPRSHPSDDDLLANAIDISSIEDDSDAGEPDALEIELDSSDGEGGARGEARQEDAGGHG